MTVDDRSGQEISKALDAAILKKSNESVQDMILLGILAGAYIGFGAIAATTVLAHAGDMPIAIKKLLAGSVFCVGLILVVIPGSELFTGNILMTAAITDRKISLSRVAKSWFFVYLGNFMGAILLAWAMLGTGLLDDLQLGATSAQITKAKIAIPFGAALLRGILCNILVCLAVILTISARTVQGKIMGIYFPIMVFVFCGFEHSIANMYFLPAGLFAKGTFFSEFFSMFKNLIPVTIGNMIGGFLVILLHPARLRSLGKAFNAPQ
jgi:formate transporter